MAFVEEDRLLTVVEAAKMLGCSPKTLYKWNALGLVPNVRTGINGRGLRFSYRRLVEWMGEHASVGPNSRVAHHG